ncbi:hypothetical protein JQ612_19825 [Bradyrhizobium manausense]|uniref:hypothetical protein n=1 Tax=Bradyrhizobium manausense TaxID=989370 RepID=UPI001BA98CD7|nr:hypothetical protein [Bradyrhizobium manausense]MBR0691122.1 hypothetical protein [Bradyrhizobium manausense]MBR0726013.1 hypothetical protein [Bradyrhizobium manausense]MBR0835441.1 hypothetical protein [Bradyrhizobium manausense]
MKKYMMIAFTLAALCGASTLAEARPPTVMNSPGYDARLQESRKALGNSQTATAPANATVLKPKHSKKKQPN